MKVSNVMITPLILLYAFSNVYSQTPDLQKAYEFNVHLSAVENGTKLYLIYQTEGKKILDSALLKNHYVQFGGHVNEIIPATVILDRHQWGPQKLLESRGEGADLLQLYLHAGVIGLVGKDSLSSAVFGKSAVNLDYELLQRNLRPIQQRQISLGRQIVAEKDLVRLKRLKSLNDSLEVARMPILKDFILKHPARYSSLTAWQQYNSYLRKINAIDTGQGKWLFDQLSPAIRDTEEGKRAAAQLQADHLLVQGVVVPDFSQPDSTGRKIRLSQFRGKYVLLDFWASWCGPCRQNSAELRRLYRDFKSEDFTIFGISLDDMEGRKDWIKAVKTDGLQWTQVSDLKHWDNAAAKLYNITAIPHYVLIGPGGELIADGVSIAEARRILMNVVATKK